ncbi:MAG: N(4)-(beta-N-acetylglucosaminyl)-L-asparaginase [Phycisphaerae bacterium]|nr:N(4)-(beta-N-acetylglucosaminyl)-L-asparaginase [Phycisphaerae bacterium]MCZ2401499.1 N(4)-(beta-N-acetylglucosaminyl)-L-asparaginase [Phycisphaerae bacterium]
MNISRRDFVQAAAGVAAAGLGGVGRALGQQAAGPGGAPGGAAGRPLVVASSNGLAACEKAMELMLAGNDPVDAVVAGVALVEDDPNDHSVGLGGLPNEEGVVQLDASVMHGPTHKAGAVAAIERIRNPSKVALLVMRRTDHVLLVGDGARRFALAHGFKEEDLLTDAARAQWLRWKENLSKDDDWLSPEESGDPSSRAHRRRPAPVLAPEWTWGTINCLGLTASGDLAGCTTTSGLSYKIPGRVGDSPIIGAGLYVDNDVGAAGSTGRGEANLQNLTSFTAVELMRQGRSPEEACLEALRRVAAKTEKRLRNAAGEPDFDLNLYALRKDGQFGGASLRRPGKMALCDRGGKARHVATPGVYAG